MKKPKFSVIIANYNGEEYINDCLESVFKTNYHSYEVILVEDGSTDRSLKIIGKFQRLYSFRIIQNETNLGLVASRNKAIKEAKGEILVFLDNDAVVDRDWLRGLSRTFSLSKNIGAVQCKIFDFKKRNIIQEVGMKLTPYTGFGNPIGRGQRDDGRFDNQEIIALGAALAVRKNVAKKIGGFDRYIFHYTDDLDFSWRVWIAGYKVVASANARVYHLTKIHRPTYKLYYHLSKNSIRMVVKNYEDLNVVWILPVTLVFNLAGALFVLITRRELMGVYGFVLGVGWNLISLIDTLKEREMIQRLRKTSDEILFAKIMTTTNILEISKQYFSVARSTVSLMKTERFREK